MDHNSQILQCTADSNTWICLLALPYRENNRIFIYNKGLNKKFGYPTKIFPPNANTLISEYTLPSLRTFLRMSALLKGIPAAEALEKLVMFDKYLKNNN